MRGAWPEARRAFADAWTAARTVARAPWLLAAAVVPVAAAKLLPGPLSGPGLAAAASRTWPLLCSAAALSAFALGCRRRLGWRAQRGLDDSVMTFCYVLVALLLSSSCGAFASERFDALMFAHASDRLSLWLRLSSLFSFALELAGMTWLLMLALGLPSVPRHPELFGALLTGARAAARRPAAAAAWIAAAVAGDWLLARGAGSLASLSGGRVGGSMLTLVAWARQALAYVLLCGAPLVATEKTA